MAAAIKMTKNLSAPETAGDYHRLICMTGKNKGICYYLNGKRIVMGRLNTNDIQIMDTQASREHIELSKVGNEYTLTDLKSQNGVVVNDLDVTQHKLKSGDKVIVGSTVYKYSFLNVKPVVNELVEYEEDEDEDEELEEEKPKKKTRKSQTGSADNKKKIIYGVILVAVAFLLFGDGEEEPAKKVAAKTSSEVIDKNSKNRIVNYKTTDDMREKVEAYIHRGRREAREGNFFRAMEEFKLALMLDPNDGEAAYHMNIAKQRLDEKIKEMFDQATKNKDSLKYNRALGTYCSIYKLLIEYKDDERFIEAEKNIEDMAQKIGMKKSENYCF